MNSLNDKFTVIIRSVGERTEQLCRELILAQGVAPANMVIVREAPFSAAMRKSFEIGIEQGLPWTFCVDADLLLRHGSIETMLKLAKEQEANVCEIQGYILDKFFGGPRPGGIHLYRTSLLPRVITNIPAEGVDIRPEKHTLKAMKAQGYPWFTAPYMVGLHDFEQYYRDIFRKCFVQAHKHLYLGELLVTFWRSRAADDQDYAVALEAFACGIAYSGQVVIDAEFEIFQEQFEGLGVREKDALNREIFTPDHVENICTNWIEPECYRRVFPTKLGLVSIKKEEYTTSRSKAPSVYERFKHSVSQIGLGRAILFAGGRLLTTIGGKFERWAGYSGK